jgi:hypothetical protein
VDHPSITGSGGSSCQSPLQEPGDLRNDADSLVRYVRSHLREQTEHDRPRRLDLLQVDQQSPEASGLRTAPRTKVKTVS